MALASLEDKIQEAERQKARLSSETDRLAERDENVGLPHMLQLTKQMDRKLQEINDERESVKAALDQAQAERSRIR